MLEVFVLIWLGGRLTAMAKAKGRSGAWALVGIGMWICGELVGFGIGAVLIGEQLGAYLVAIAGAVVGGIVGYQIVAGLSDITGETSETAERTVPIEESQLRAEIDSLKARCQSGPSEFTAGNLFGLGCAYARLFDVTKGDAERASALKYMSKAAELDPTRAKLDPFFDAESASSLFSEPEFEQFVG
jgi:hypothetical protein